MTQTDAAELKEIVDSIAEAARKVLALDADTTFFMMREQALANPTLQHYRTQEQIALAQVRKAYDQAIINCEQLLQQSALSASDQACLQQLSSTYALTDGLKVCGQPGSLPAPKVSIIGGGLSGLLAAYALSKAGAQVVVHEARAKARATLRIQNISFKEAEKHLRPLFGEILYQEFFARGAILDGDSGKLRVTIGCFQEILLEALADLPVQIYYENQVDISQCQQRDNPDMVIVSSGVHSCERLALHDDLLPVSYPEYSAKGKTVLFLRESEEPHGYTRSGREGQHWRRENKTIFSGQTLASDIHRAIANLREPSDEQIAQLEALLDCATVEYSFNFGNDSPNFLDNVTADYQPLLQSNYCIVPMFARRLICQRAGVTVLALGDANGSAHPLAAIGTLKFVRNIAHVVPFVFSHQAIRILADNNAGLAPSYEVLQHACQALYQSLALCNTKQVLFENVLSCVFSEARGS